MKREIVAALAFFGLGMLLMLAGVLPMFRGHSMNVIFFALGAFWIIVAIAVAGKLRKPSPDAAQVK